MKLFTIDKNGKFVPYKERTFQEEHKEVDLEILLENNPEYFFDDEKLLVIGRQITTNFNTVIDLLGIDKYGNTVAIELKRGKTPRDTIAQILEYASFVENLDYEQLNEIFQNYSGEEIGLDKYQLQYFQHDAPHVSFNKTTKLVIVAQDISPEIKQTALYLRKNGIAIYCVEFKYFVNKANEKMLSSDFVVGDEEFIKQKVKSAGFSAKINKQQFIAALDTNGLAVFNQLFDFAKQENLLLRWGAKGFSLNVPFDTAFVGIFFAYPPNAVFKQSIYTCFEEITKKVHHSHEVIAFYKHQIIALQLFEPAQSQYKWLISQEYPTEKIQAFMGALQQIIAKVKHYGVKGG